MIHESLICEALMGAAGHKPQEGWLTFSTEEQGVT